MTRESVEAIVIPLLILGIALYCLSGCAPERFTKDGVVFQPVPREAVVAVAVNLPHDYRADAVTIRNTHTVWRANDTVMSPSLTHHELKHLMQSKYQKDAV